MKINQCESELFWLGCQNFNLTKLLLMYVESVNFWSGNQSFPKPIIATSLS